MATAAPVTLSVSGAVVRPASPLSSEELPSAKRQRAEKEKDRATSTAPREEEAAPAAVNGGDAAAATIALSATASVTGPTDLAPPVTADAPVANPTNATATAAAEGPLFTALTTYTLSAPGKRSYQHDRSVTRLSLASAASECQSGRHRYAAFTLFDGHGSEAASQWLSAHMIDKLERSIVESSTAAITKSAATAAVNVTAPTAAATIVETPEAHTARIRKCILSCFRESERELCAWLAARKDEGSGSCALLTLFDGQSVWVAHVGDSRAVLAREKPAVPAALMPVAAVAAIPSSTSAASSATVLVPAPWQAVSLTTDHSCILAAERARVESAGGFVDGDGRINGRLGVSRALGDRALKKPAVPHSLVSAVPDIARFVFKSATASSSPSAPPAERALLLASDGVWDVLTPSQAVALVQGELERITELEQADRVAGRKPLAATHTNSGAVNSESPRQFACHRAVECVMRELAQRHVQDNVTVTLVLFDHPPPSPSLPPSCASAAVTAAVLPHA